MSSDLIALIVAMGLGAVVVAIGLRRDLAETTRSNLPRFEGDRDPWVATGPVDDGRRRWQPSPKQARWLASLNLLLALGYAADAVLSVDDRLLHAVFAALFALAAVVLVLRARRGASVAEQEPVSRSSPPARR